MKRLKDAVLTGVAAALIPLMGLFMPLYYWYQVLRGEIIRVDQQGATDIVRGWLERNPGEHYALDLSKQLKLPPSQLYIALMRLERQGIAEKRWVPADTPGGRRMAYRRAA